MKKVVIVGAGPHSKVVIDILEENGEYEIVGLTDAHLKGSVLDYPILGTDSILSQLIDDGVKCAIVAVGKNSIRKKIFSSLQVLGYEMISAVSNHAIVSKHAQVGNGVAVMPGAIINCGAIIADGTIVNTNASVDHDCNIGEFVHIAPGCAISGSTIIGNETFLGTGSRIIDGINIGAGVMVGAGSVVISDVEDFCEVVGVPAKIIKRFEQK